MSKMQHIDAADRAEAVRRAPWAQYVVKTPQGWLGFETLAAFSHWAERHQK